MEVAARPMTMPVALARATHPGPALAVTIGSAGLAVAAGLSFGTTLLVAAAVLTGQLSIGWSNDLVDLARDRETGRTDKPLAAEESAVGAARVACGAAVVACVVLSLACGVAAGLVHLACVAAAWAYNLRLKSTVMSWLPYAVAFGLLPVFVGLTRGARMLPWWVAVAGALLGVGAHLVNVVPDLGDDAATGVRGLPHRLGARGSTVLAVALLALASLVLVAGAHASLGAAGWVGLALVAALAVVSLTGGGRTPFRAAIAIALVDVVILVWAL